MIGHGDPESRTHAHTRTHTHTKKKCGPPSACPWAAPRKGFGGLSGARGPPRMYMRRRSGGLRRPLWPARRRQRHSVLARHGWGWGKAVTGHATFPSGHVTPKTHSNQKSIAVAGAPARSPFRRHRASMRYVTQACRSACSTIGTPMTTPQRKRLPRERRIHVQSCRLGLEAQTSAVHSIWPRPRPRPPPPRLHPSHPADAVPPQPPPPPTSTAPSPHSASGLRRDPRARPKLATRNCDARPPPACDPSATRTQAMRPN